ncbi:MAG: MoxR family ATPase [Planctomycetes bacterium]|jgi:MoxR-like ATPase|nr:MoxR family ATPase [Planctomycetota bacterium]
MAGQTSSEAEDLKTVQQLRDAHDAIIKELHKVVVGQEDVIEQLLIAIFARGHALLVGVPGLAKTLLIRTLADTMSLKFSRIQFTPDLMPSDITGTEVLQEDKTTGRREFRFLPGPIFANIILADEINRTPPKTQAALLEAMQEIQVTAGGRRHQLEAPFFVLATQNPIEQEGTYPLPEAQQDRFMFNIKVEYPAEEEELMIMKMTTATYKGAVEHVLDGAMIMRLQELVRKVPISEHVIKYAMQFSRLTRLNNPQAPDFIKQYLAWGAGPRASQFLILGAKARAVLQGRYYASGEDVRAVAHPVLRHRIIPNFSAEAEGITSDVIIDKLIELIPRAEAESLADRRLPNVMK